MGILLCEQNCRDVWRRNQNVRAEIGQILHTHTHAAQLVVRIKKLKDPKVKKNCERKLVADLHH